MTDEQAWRLFFATGLPGAWLLTRENREKHRTEGHGPASPRP